jgi:hypothetical protein
MQDLSRHDDIMLATENGVHMLQSSSSTAARAVVILAAAPAGTLLLPLHLGYH